VPDRALTGLRGLEVYSTLAAIESAQRTHVVLAAPGR